MSQSNERGANTERNSALWGTGGRGGDRSRVLWGKGGRGIVDAMVALAIAGPMAATAKSGSPPAPVANNFIAPSLLTAKGKVDVIIQSAGGLADANAKMTGLGVFQKDIKQLALIGAVEATVPASQIKKLQGVSGITVTPDAQVQVSATPSSSQLWPYESGNSQLWAGDVASYSKSTPAIAV